MSFGGSLKDVKDNGGLSFHPETRAQSFDDQFLDYRNNIFDINSQMVNFAGDAKKDLTLHQSSSTNNYDFASPNSALEPNRSSDFYQDSQTMTYSPNSVSKLASAKIESRSLGKSPLNVIKKEPGFEQERRSTQVNSDKGKVKSAHNVIEQRYRNKINDKFTALQHSVPTLRVILDKRDPSMSEEGLKESHLGDLDALSDSSVNLEGLEPATKLNKGTILAKTVEYIKFLEGKNKSLTMEYQQVLARAQMLGIEVEGNFQIKEENV